MLMMATSGLATGAPVASEIGPIEAVNGSALAVDIDVGTAERQTLIGYGWGAASINMSHWTAANVTKLCEDMGATVVRYFTPEGSSFTSDHLAHWNLVSAHGIDTIFSSSFVYRTANPLNIPPNIVGAANGIDAAMDGGINPSNGWWATLQNEPDGHADNNPTTDGVNTATQAQIRAHYQTFRTQLNSIGRSAVNALGLEYRHPETMTDEFDEFDNNDLFANGIVQGQCFHIYNKGPRPEYYDQRLMLQGLNFFSTETGDNGNTAGNMSSPYTSARYISGLNNGVQVEIMHAAIGGVDGDGKVQVLINSSDGVPRNWYQASKITSKHMIRGTVMRLCSSSDRPTDPTMPVTQATRMFLDSRTGSGGCLCQPRQFVGCGRRADGRWVLAAVHFAYDTKVETTFAGGHYGVPVSPGPNQQLTVDIPELSTFDSVWSGQRATRDGGVANTTVNMHDGLMRFTLVPGETIAITTDVADGIVPIPADALDRSAYGAPTSAAATTAWIADMTAQGKAGKVGSGTYAFASRQILTQSIYGYGATKPIFKGPGDQNNTRALSFLYVHASNVRVTGVAFEDINMPFISCDDTVNDDWGDALIPMSGYGWNSNEYGLASHYYNQDLINLQIDHCDFTNCGVCVMLVRHGDPDIAPIASRIHDGFKFTDNVVRDGMGCVCLLGYQFRNFDLSRNDVRNMTGSTFGGASANHTDTIFMLGGINNPLKDSLMMTNSVTISDNTVIGFTSTHGQNNKNGAVYVDIRGGGNILSERNHVENCYSTGGTQDCNAVYLKSKFNIRFNNNFYKNCGSRPVDSAANHGSESQFYTFKGDTTDVISTDDIFETGPQCGNSPWIQAGTATDFTMIRPTFRGWRNDGTWWGRPGVPCMIHHWQGDRFVTVDAVLEDCGWTGTQAYAVAHRDRAGGVCSHTGMRANFNNNATAIIGKGSGDATVSLSNCQNTTGQNLTLVTGLS